LKSGSPPLFQLLKSLQNCNIYEEEPNRQVEKVEEGSQKGVLIQKHMRLFRLGGKNSFNFGDFSKLESKCCCPGRGQGNSTYFFNF
jgi:hypothetical protein